ncbi:MAG: RNA recognition motif domain-containing protein [Kiritimatiellia bacterium]|jgi:RNA recognition motif-containing protein
MDISTLSAFVAENFNVYSIVLFVLGVLIGLCLPRRRSGSPKKKGRAKSAGRASQNAGKRQGKERAAAPKQTPVQLAPGDVELYVGNLSYDTTEADLRKEFERFGKVSSVRIIINRFSSKSKGFGFIVMPNRPEAESAVKAMNDRELQGRKLRVNEARDGSPRE